MFEAKLTIKNETIEGITAKIEHKITNYLKLKPTMFCQKINYEYYDGKT